MTRTNLPNTQHGHQVALDLLHGDRRFFPTARQQQLCEALLSAPFPENLDQRDGEQAPVSDSLVLLGYGGAMGGGKTREGWQTAGWFVNDSVIGWLVGGNLEANGVLWVAQLNSRAESLGGVPAGQGAGDPTFGVNAVAGWPEAARRTPSRRTRQLTP